MKFVLNFLKWLFILLGLVVLGLLLTGNKFLIKGVWATYLHGFNSASIGDSRFFNTRTVEDGKEIPWPVAPNYNQTALSQPLKDVFDQYGAVAYLVVKKGEIVHEQYWDDYSDTSHSNSFSMAKSITTMLVQCAIQDGYMTSWDQKVKDFLPDLQGEFADELTLRHLSTMTAGLDFNEHYTNPFDITARLYYSDNVHDLLIDRVPVAHKPGDFEYQSGATEFLGLAIREATGKSLAEYASEKLWKPMGAAHPAWWHLDSKGGRELAFCCFNSNGRDFARFGQMLLHHGNFNGTQILDSAFVANATQPFAVPFYGHSFWLDHSHGTDVFYQRGILGQYIIVIPERDMVIVRLGHHRGEKVDAHTNDFHTILEETLKLF